MFRTPPPARGWGGEGKCVWYANQQKSIFLRRKHFLMFCSHLVLFRTATLKRQCHEIAPNTNIQLMLAFENVKEEGKYLYSVSKIKTALTNIGDQFSKM